MADTKRGRERTGANKRHHRRQEEIQRAVELALEEEPATEFEGTMTAVYTVGRDGDDVERIDCHGFRDVGHGVVLVDAAGEEVAYVSHEHLVAIEPARR